MIKYSEKDVIDYLNGLDIENIMELENNAEFMFDVIKLSNDKKMYYYCSKEIQLNYHFVQKLLLLFKDDINFITFIADNFLSKEINNINDYDEKINILLMIMNYLEKDNIKYNNYGLLLESLKKDYEQYKEKYEKLLVNLMANDFFHYYDIHSDDFPKKLAGYKIYLYLANKLNLIDKILKYDKDDCEYELIDEENLPFITRKRLLELEKIMQKGLKS